MSESRKTRRGHGEGTYGKRKDGRWEARVTFDDGGRRTYYGRTQTEVRAKATQARKDFAEGLDLKSQRVTVERFLTRWLDDTAKQRVRPSTYASYKGHIEHHLIPRLGRHRVRDLSVQHVNAMLAALVNEHNEHRISPTTANRVRATLRTALASAMRWGIVSRNVAALAEPRKESRTRIAPLTPAQARAFIAATADDRLGGLYYVAIATGLRQGELLALRWEDVDLDAGRLTVRHTLTRNGQEWAFSEPKTDQSRRTVALTPGAIAAVKRQRTRTLEAQLLAGARWQGDRYRLVFPSTVGTPQNNANVTSRLQALLAKHKLPRQRFHDLRHLAASLLLSEGETLFGVKELLGHSQISLTADTYGHLTEQGASAAADRMERALNGLPADDKNDDKTSRVDDKTDDGADGTQRHQTA